MGIIQERTKQVTDLTAKIKAHCMTLHFEETPTHYRVIYPDGYFPNGVQASKEVGKIVALEMVLESIEAHWQNSFVRGC